MNIDEIKKIYGLLDEFCEKHTVDELNGLSDISPEFFGEILEALELTLESISGSTPAEKSASIKAKIDELGQMFIDDTIINAALDAGLNEDKISDFLGVLGVLRGFDYERLIDSKPVKKDSDSGVDSKKYITKFTFEGNTINFDESDDVYNKLDDQISAVPQSDISSMSQDKVDEILKGIFGLKLVADVSVAMRIALLKDVKNAYERDFPDKTSNVEWLNKLVERILDIEKTKNNEKVVELTYSECNAQLDSIISTREISGENVISTIYKNVEVEKLEAAYPDSSDTSKEDYVSLLLGDKIVTPDIVDTTFGLTDTESTDFTKLVRFLVSEKSSSGVDLLSDDEILGLDKQELLDLIDGKEGQNEGRGLVAEFEREIEEQKRKMADLLGLIIGDDNKYITVAKRIELGKNAGKDDGVPSEVYSEFVACEKKLLELNLKKKLLGKLKGKIEACSHVVTKENAKVVLKFVGKMAKSSAISYIKSMLGRYVTMGAGTLVGATVAFAFPAAVPLLQTFSAAGLIINAVRFGLGLYTKTDTALKVANFIRTKFINKDSAIGKFINTLESNPDAKLLKVKNSKVLSILTSPLAQQKIRKIRKFANYAGWFLNGFAGGLAAGVNIFNLDSLGESLGFGGLKELRDKFGLGEKDNDSNLESNPSVDDSMSETLSPETTLPLETTPSTETTLPSETLPGDTLGGDAGFISSLSHKDVFGGKFVDTDSNSKGFEELHVGDKIYNLRLNESGTGYHILNNAGDELPDLNGVGCQVFDGVGNDGIVDGFTRVSPEGIATSWFKPGDDNPIEKFNGQSLAGASFEDDTLTFADGVTWTNKFGAGLSGDLENDDITDSQSLEYQLSDLRLSGLKLEEVDRDGVGDTVHFTYEEDGETLGGVAILDADGDVIQVLTGDDIGAKGFSYNGLYALNEDGELEASSVEEGTVFSYDSDESGKISINSSTIVGGGQDTLEEPDESDVDAEKPEVDSEKTDVDSEKPEVDSEEPVLEEIDIKSEQDFAANLKVAREKGILSDEQYSDFLTRYMNMEPTDVEAANSLYNELEDLWNTQVNGENLFPELDSEPVIIGDKKELFDYLTKEVENNNMSPEEADRHFSGYLQHVGEGKDPKDFLDKFSDVINGVYNDVAFDADSGVYVTGDSSIDYILNTNFSSYSTNSSDSPLIDMSSWDVWGSRSADGILNGFDDDDVHINTARYGDQTLVERFFYIHDGKTVKFEGTFNEFLDKFRKNELPISILKEGKVAADVRNENGDPFYYGSGIDLFINLADMINKSDVVGKGK